MPFCSVGDALKSPCILGRVLCIRKGRAACSYFVGFGYAEECGMCSRVREGITSPPSLPFTFFFLIVSTRFLTRDCHTVVIIDIINIIDKK